MASDKTVVSLAKPSTSTSTPPATQRRSPELQKVAQEAKRAKAIRIEGNCDERGTTEFNLALATRVLAPLRPIWSDSACARTGSPRSAMAANDPGPGP